ncbi:MAG: hypothetical protein Q8M15_02155 [Bacteroidota bacterium]|nr:hypothetical protein [Bacteroidota bacterium]
MNINTERTEAEKALEEIQNIRNPNQNVKTKQRFEESLIIDNLAKIEAINKRGKFLEEQIRENPFDLLVVAWELELAKLSFEEDKLLKRNQKLHKRLGTKPQEINSTPLSPQIRNYPTTGYVPISMSSYLLMDIEMSDIEKKLENIYTRKDNLYMLIQQSETGIADSKIKDELNELILVEASLLSQIEERRLSKEMLYILNKEHKSNSKEDEFKNPQASSSKDSHKLVSFEEIQEPQNSSNEIDKDDRIEELGSNSGNSIPDEVPLNDSEEIEAFEEIQDFRDSLESDLDMSYEETQNIGYDRDT